MLYPVMVLLFSLTVNAAAKDTSNRLEVAKNFRGTDIIDSSTKAEALLITFINNFDVIGEHNTDSTKKTLKNIIEQLKGLPQLKLASESVTESARNHIKSIILFFEEQISESKLNKKEIKIKFFELKRILNIPSLSTDGTWPCWSLHNELITGKKQLMDAKEIDKVKFKNLLSVYCRTNCFDKVESKKYEDELAKIDKKDETYTRLINNAFDSTQLTKHIENTFYTKPHQFAYSLLLMGIFGFSATFALVLLLRYIFGRKKQDKDIESNKDDIE